MWFDGPNCITIDFFLPLYYRIRAALLHEGQLIAFASRALTDTQKENEVLAIVFAAEKFEQCTFDHTVPMSLYEREHVQRRIGLTTAGKVLYKHKLLYRIRWNRTSHTDINCQYKTFFSSVVDASSHRQNFVTHPNSECIHHTRR